MESEKKKTFKVFKLCDIKRYRFTQAENVLGILVFLFIEVMSYITQTEDLSPILKKSKNGLSNETYDKRWRNFSKNIHAAREYLKSTSFLMYFSHFLSAWDDRMWQFAVGIFLIELSPGSLRLTAIFGLSAGGATLLLGAIVGNWIDKTPRLRVARTTLFYQNACMVLCGIAVFLLFFYQPEINALWNGWLLVICHAIVIFLAVVAHIASIATTIAIERDWIATICGKDLDFLADMSSAMRRIDLITNTVAPIAAGQIMTFTSLTDAILFMSSWFLVSFFIEYYMLWKVYVSVPELAYKAIYDEIEDGDRCGKSKAALADDINRSNATEMDDVTAGHHGSYQAYNDPNYTYDDPDIYLIDNEEKNLDIEEKNDKNKSNKENEMSVENEKENKNKMNGLKLSNDSNAANSNNKYYSFEEMKQSEKEKQKTSCCSGFRECILGFLSPFVILINGWMTYMQYTVSLSGLGLAFLYMTVLGFDSITVGYAYSQNISESLIGILMAGGALAGVVGTFMYPSLRRIIGLERTGLIAFMCLTGSITVCLFSIWMPGTAFDVIAYALYRVHDVANCTMGNITHLASVTNSPLNYSAGSYMTNVTEGYSMDSAAWNCTNAADFEIPESYLSIGMLMGGIVASRLGLWLVDLTVTQQQLEAVDERERGIVNGVQNSINMLMDMLKYAMVVTAPNPGDFGYLIIISYIFMMTGFVFYAIYTVKVRGHLCHFDRLFKMFDCCFRKNNNNEKDVEYDMINSKK